MRAEIKIAIPSVPSYVKMEDAPHNSAPIDIGHLSDGELTELAEEWKGALLAKAVERRKELDKK